MNSYSKTVTTSSALIAPSLNTKGADFAAGAVLAGAYAYNPANDTTYWAITAGTAVTAPTHTRGVDTVDSIDWLAVNDNRYMIVSVHGGSEVTLGRDSEPTIDEGIFVYAPYDMGTYPGEVYAISAGSVVVGVSCE